MYEKDFNEDFKCLFDVTFFGFLLVSLVQIVAIVFGNESEIMVINRNILMPKNVFPNIIIQIFALRKTSSWKSFCNLQNVLFSMCGCVLYMAIGVTSILFVNNGSKNMTSIGSLSILTSLIYFGDMLWTGFNIKNHSGYITIPITPLLSTSSQPYQNILETQVSVMTMESMFYCWLSMF